MIISIESLFIDAVKFVGLIMLIALVVGFVVGILGLVYQGAEASKEIRRRREFCEGCVQEVREVYEEMKQDKRFQKFFVDVKSILVEHKNEIEYARVTMTLDCLHICLHKEINKWDISDNLNNFLNIKFSDYQFRLSSYIDSEAMIYWMVQEIPFMVYRYRISQQGEERDYETKDIMNVIRHCMGGDSDTVREMYVKGNKF